MHSYLYLGKDGKPLTSCPMCGSSLCRENGIDLNLSCAGHCFSVLTQLTEDGILIDVDDAVGRGNHSATCCNKCGEMLVDYEEECDITN